MSEMATKKRLIDANDVKELINGLSELPWEEEVDYLVDELPTVDAVEVVRCKDCKHCEVTPDSLRWCNAWGGINGMGDEGFCNYGERRTDES